jgi:diguanylate cyclase (GGDEF)-like protein
MKSGLQPLAAAMSVNRIDVYRLVEVNNESQVKQMYRWDSSDGGLTGRSVLSNNPVVINWLKIASQDICVHKQRQDLSEDEIAFLKQSGIQSLLIVPVFLRGKLWGGTAFYDCVNERHFDTDCMDLYRSAARLCVNTILQAEVMRKSDEALETLKHREKKMETLLNVAIVFFSRCKTLSDEMMTIGINLIADLVHIDQLSVWRNTATSGDLHASQIYCWSKKLDSAAAPPPLLLQDVAYSQFVLPLEKIFAFGDSINCPISLIPDNSLLKTFDIKSVFIAPVFVGNILWGFVLFADTHREYTFSALNAEMMSSAAFLVANTVIRADLEHEIADRDELNHVMFDTAPIGLVLFDEHCRVIDCNETILRMHGVPKQYYLDHFASFSPEYQPDGSKSCDRSLEIMKQALNGENPIMEWMHCTGDESIPCELTLTRTLYKGKYLGVGYIYDLRNVKKLEANVEWLESVACQIYDDPLTGIHNRRYFDENLERIIKLLSRSDSTLSLLMIDIDYFKKFNDTYGHIEGDKCLKTIAETLKKSITRTDDFVARYGGEEFVVVLPHTDENGARLIANRLHENIRKSCIPHRKSDVAKYVTISIGGTTGIVNHVQDGDDYIRRADEMLYLSKQNGRNRSSFCALKKGK